MAPSRVILAVAVALAGCALACDALLGLGGYQEVPCIDCGQDTGAAGDAGPDVFDAGMEASLLQDAQDASDGGDASDADADADADATPTFDGSVDGPPLTELWARWNMPNPDASSAPTIVGSPSLPNPMAYDAGADAGTAFDVVTKLTWTRESLPAGTFGAAVAQCAAQPGTGWHVPTRIQVVSLIDFTQPIGAPKIDPVAFPSTPTARFWTSSQVPGDAATPLYWLVDFSTGLVQETTTASYVRCVKEGP
jgi:hypothetical protein